MEHPVDHDSDKEPVILPFRNSKLFPLYESFESRWIAFTHHDPSVVRVLQKRVMTQKQFSQWMRTAPDADIEEGLRKWTLEPLEWIQGMAS